MPPKKRIADDSTSEEPVPKRRSLRQAHAASAFSASKLPAKESSVSKKKKGTSSVKPEAPETENPKKGVNQSPTKPTTQPKKASQKEDAAKKTNKTDKTSSSSGSSGSRAFSEDPNVDDIPAINPDAPKHDGEWYWLMKAEPESRFENGIDVRFSIDDLRAKTKPEGWDGIRAYAARNNMRNMNVGDKAFFYHSNCKQPGIVGIMEIVKEFSEDRSARRPGTPYYDPNSTRGKPRWDLVHVEFRKKFAVPIYLPELRELGKPGSPLENMQMLKQSRLSVSKVSGDEFKALCEIADEKAKEAGLEHEE